MLRGLLAVLGKLLGLLPLLGAWAAARRAERAEHLRASLEAVERARQVELGVGAMDADRLRAERVRWERD